MRQIIYVCMIVLALASLLFANDYSAGAGSSSASEIKAQIEQLKAQGQYNEVEWYGILAQMEREPQPAGNLDQGADQCPATVIGALPFNDTGTTIGKSADVSGCVGTAPDVIYSMTLATGTGVLVSLCGSGYDTQLIVRTGGACPGNEQVACNDDSPCGAASQLEFCANAGQTYYIVVSGFAGNFGDYAIGVRAAVDSPCVFGRCCYGFNTQCSTTNNFNCADLFGFFTAGETCDNPCPPPPPECVCGPMDLVFVVDTTGSMGGAIASVAAGLPAIIATANYFSCDVRLGLVTFGDQVVVKNQLTANQALVQANISALTATGGGNFPECSDEALLEVVNGGSSCAVNNWTSIFRPAAAKIIVLITDALPGGCDDTYGAGIDDVQAHNVALAAQAASIRIASVFVPTNGVDPTIVSIMQDYAATTSGSYWQTAANGQGTGAAINTLVADCGQGILQIFAPVPNLECINGQITPNPINFNVTVTNSGNEDCGLVSLSIGAGAGTGGTGTAIPNNVFLGGLPFGGFIDVPVTFTLFPNQAGGFICFRAEVTSENCPPAFLDICFEVPPCAGCDFPNPVYVDVSEGIPHCECIQACPGVPLHLCFGPLSEDERPSEVRFDDGCDGDPFREAGLLVPGYNCDNYECPPAFPTPRGDWYYDPAVGVWCIEVIVEQTGCFCVCIDDILPVELTAFDAVAGDESVSLSWTTASEVDNDRFEILRDASIVTAIDAHNSATGSHYTWTDDYNLTNGREYTYSLVAVSMNGIRETIGTVSASPSSAAVATITEYALHQNYPNPFNPETSITFDLVEAGNVTLTVYNPLGMTVATLVDDAMTSGRHSVTFDAASLPSGLYFYRLDAGEFSAVKKMVLMK